MFVVRARILYSKFTILLNCVTFTRVIYIPSASVARSRKNYVEWEFANAFCRCHHKITNILKLLFVKLNPDSKQKKTKKFNVKR